MTLILLAIAITMTLLAVSWDRKYLRAIGETAERYDDLRSLTVERDELAAENLQLQQRRDEVQTALTELSIEHEALKKELAAKTAELESLKVKIVTKAKSKAKK